MMQSTFHAKPNVILGHYGGRLRHDRRHLAQQSCKDQQVGTFGPRNSGGKIRLAHWDNGAIVCIDGHLDSAALLNSRAADGSGHLADSRR